MADVPPVKMTLFGLYMILLMYLILDILVILRSGHKKKSFRMGFVCLLGLWTLNRAIFWGIISLRTVENMFAQRFLFWMPLPVQCATFSFLLLYYSKVLKPNEWEDGDKFFYKSIYGLVNIGVHATTIAWIFVAVGPGYETDWVDKIWLVFQSVVFLLLAVGYGVATYMLTRKEYQSVKQLPIQHATVVNLTIIVCFGSRFIIDVLEENYYDDDWRKHCCSLDYHHDKDLHYTAVLLYVFWELVPTCLTLLFVANAGGKFGLVALLTRGASSDSRFAYDPETGEYLDTTLVAVYERSNDDGVGGEKDIFGIGSSRWIEGSSINSHLGVPGDTVLGAQSPYSSDDEDDRAVLARLEGRA